MKLFPFYHFTFLQTFFYIKLAAFFSCILGLMVNSQLPLWLGLIAYFLNLIKHIPVFICKLKLVSFYFINDNFSRWSVSRVWWKKFSYWLYSEDLCAPYYQYCVYGLPLIWFQQNILIFLDNILNEGGWIYRHLISSPQAIYFLDFLYF